MCAPKSHCFYGFVCTNRVVQLHGVIFISITHWLWLKFRTNKFLAFAKPSGMDFNLLCDKSIVVNSSNWNSSAGTPDAFILLCRKLSERKHASSVTSPYNFSSSLYFNDKCSSFINFPISSGISFRCVLSNFSHWTPLIRRTALGKLSS